MDRKFLFLITVFAEGGLFFLGLILMRFSQLALWSKIDFSWSATAFALLLCIPMVGMLFFAVRSRWEAMSRFRNEVYEKIVPVFANVKLPDLALIALLAGAGEELFFRGWLQSLLASKLQGWQAILIASVIFGLAHSLSTTYAIYAGLTGLYLGLIYQASGNLYIVMIVHALYDFVALLYLVTKGTGEGTRLPAAE